MTHNTLLVFEVTILVLAITAYVGWELSIAVSNLETVLSG